ncbi:MAG: nickel-dependent lactate racemase [Clostridia bacterium]
MEPFHLRYGEGEVVCDMTGARSITTLQPQPLPPMVDVKAAFLAAMAEDCVDSPPLRALLTPGDLVTIILSDITRFWMRQDVICKLLVDYLHDVVGVPDENMVLLVALGTHRPQTEAECQRLVTPEIYARIRVVNHDAEAPDLQYVGTTTYGTRVCVHPLAVGRKVILIGGTVHHLMAGFGGGRKSILPGVSAKETINQNHLHALSPDAPCSNPRIGLGVLAGNPLHADMVEAAAFVHPLFGINIVADDHSRLCGLFCGHWLHAWEKSCAQVQAAFGVPIDAPADLVVASCGGYPKDINLYQATKSLLNAARAVRPGGTLLFLARCKEGGGAPAFFSWITSLQRGTLDADLRADFSIAGYIFYAACEAIARATVYMLTDIPADTVRPMGLHAASSLDVLLPRIDFTGKRVYVMEAAGSVVPMASND